MSDKNIFPQKHKIDKEKRNGLTGNRSILIWLTGISGSGKSTIAEKLEEKLFSDNILTYLLDGDNIRTGICRDLGFEEQDRIENIRRIGEISKLMVDAGLVVIGSFISPFRADRNKVRKLLNDGEFVEVYVKCPLEIAEERDVKGLYKKARKGEIKNFTGIDSPYEEPASPEIIIETSKQSIDESADILYNFIKPLLKKQD